MAVKELLGEIGARINVKRKELGITQEALAEKMDVSVQMISNLEKGKKAIRPENLVKVCEALGISADYILRGTFSSIELVGFVDKYSRLSAKNQKMIESLVESLLEREPV